MAYSFLIPTVCFFVGFFIAILFFTQENFGGDVAESVALFQQRAPEADVPPEAGNLFHPPPAVTERIQSVQYEHLQNIDINFNLEYQQKYSFPIVTGNNPNDAVNNQIMQMKTILHKEFDSWAMHVGMTAVTFDSVFRNLGVPQLKSALSPAMLQAFLEKLSDDIFDQLARIFYTFNIKINPTGGASQLHPPKNNSTSLVLFPNKSNVRLDGDILVQEPRATTSKPLTALTQSQLLSSAQKYVVKSYGDLLVKYQYELNDVPRTTYQNRISEVKNTGMEMVKDLFSRHDVTVQNLDEFTNDVEEAMTETVFEILMDSGVDPNQFH